MKAVSVGLFLMVLLGWASDWPMMYHDPAHTSATSDPGPDADTLAWSYQIGPALGSGWDYIHISSPAVVDGKIYVSAINGRVYCFDHAEGPPIWVRQLRDTIFSSPAVVAGKVYVGTWRGDLYCLDATTGDSLWRYHSGGMIETGPTVADGRVFFGAWYQNYIWCLNGTTGARLWQATPDPGFMYGHGGLPAVHDSLAVVGASQPGGSTKFYAYREFSSTPDTEWVYSVAAGDNHQAPAIADSRVLGSVDDGWLYCFSETSGASLWSQRSAPGYSGDPSCVSIASNRIYYGHEVGYVYCRDLTSGGLVWRSPHLGGHCGVGSASLSGNGMIYVGTGYAGGGPSTKALFCLDQATGDTLWSHATGGYVTSSPAISNGMVFVTSHDGYLYAFGTWGAVAVAEGRSTPSPVHDLPGLQVSPNPFTNSATIALAGKALHRATGLRVYDRQGRPVKSLPLPRSPAADFRSPLFLSWDGTDDLGRELASGVYFVRLEWSGGAETRELLRVWTSRP
jgi:outer membrane protein assembly factor BamB